MKQLWPQWRPRRKEGVKDCDVVEWRRKKEGVKDCDVVERCGTARACWLLHVERDRERRSSFLALGQA